MGERERVRGKGYMGAIMGEKGLIMEVVMSERERLVVAWEVAMRELTDEKRLARPVVDESEEDAGMLRVVCVCVW
ncbi:unnamed protein product [Dovyalis caffra]|uniref:Uncharacterized protein n=1 Tax=Dovyalis caffra TaxID=77055 RepID=A0AAV1SP42_9ROSI|nr:unnamed protein product [Dovyalis caffra]